MVRKRGDGKDFRRKLCFIKASGKRTGCGRVAILKKNGFQRKKTV